jgi:hypothetical protein
MFAGFQQLQDRFIYEDIKNRAFYCFTPPKGTKYRVIIQVIAANLAKGQKCTTTSICGLWVCRRSNRGEGGPRYLDWLKGAREKQRNCWKTCKTLLNFKLSFNFITFRVLSRWGIFSVLTKWCLCCKRGSHCPVGTSNGFIEGYAL